MAKRLNTSLNGFEQQFAELLGAKRGISRDVSKVVAEIIDDVRQRGDGALTEYTSRFDKFDFDDTAMAVSVAEIEDALTRADEKSIAALTLARDRITSHHQRQMPEDERYTDAIGVELGSRWNAIENVGLYVPGGTASYPSSVLMNAVPAQVAGVKRIVMVVPAPGGTLNPMVLVAAHLAGVSEIYRIGGAQAIAALAYGTKTIAPVDKIVGPGNAYVAEAKRQVFGTVGIDMIAGPSEVLVVADASNNPDWMALDLLAQAEHDVTAQSILITDDGEFADAVERAVEAQLAQMPRREIAAASWRDFGAIIVVENIEQSIALIDRIAPEHLQLAIDDAEALFAKIRNAGAVFLGRFTPEAIGDYIAGSNHVLPTSRSARFSSGLSVLDFLKRTSVLRCGLQQLAAIGPTAITLAEIEGLTAHGRSVAARLNN